MKRGWWIAAAGAVLLPLSAALYFVHYLIFHDPHHIFVYMLGDIAFVPIEVFLVVVVLERMLNQHERSLMLNKMNMVIGTFFSELGTHLLGQITGAIDKELELRQRLSIGTNWSPTEFRRALEFAGTFDYKVDIDKLDLDALRENMARRRQLLLSLLANPNLMEHDRFTDLLWAVFHLLEELVARDSFDNLPKTDKNHLALDVHRVYSHLTTEWLMYCEHLKKAYPFIFSIVVRTHPLQENPSPVVGG